MYDIVIIGGGVVGCLVAMQLSKYDIKICLVEKENDVSMGTTKANSAIIHAGYDSEANSLKAKLNVRGNEMMTDLACDLDVPFNRVGSLVVAFNEDDKKTIQELYDRGVENKVSGMQIWDQNQVRKNEPNLSKDITCALYASTAGIICPYEMTIAAAEVAVENGMDLLLNTEVLDISKEDSFLIKTNNEDIEAKIIINAAGLFTDKIASMIGDNSFKILPRKGEYLIFDKKIGGEVSRIVFQPPSHMGKGVLVTPTVDGNLLVGPTAQDIDDKEDVATTKKGLEYISVRGAKTYPKFSMKDVINSFSGLRAKTKTGDFIIEESKMDSDFINIAGIDSPGLSACPAIAEYVLNMVLAKNSNFMKKENYKTKRRPVVRFRDLSIDEKAKMIKLDSNYGQIVCRCEGVTKGEIVDCIRRKVGARDVDGVKRRARAGMGRCQGGFCVQRVMQILSDELDIPFEKVTKKGEGSKLVY